MVRRQRTRNIKTFIVRYGKFYNHYGYDEQRHFSHATAGGFDTFEEAEKALYAHRPKAEKVLEPAEKAGGNTPTEPDYRLLDRLCSDCEYYLGAGQFSEKHLWAGSNVVNW